MDSDKFDSIENPGMKIRAKWIEKGKFVELYGKIHADMFNQPRLLLNNVDMKVVLNLEKSSFFLMSGEDIPHVKLRIFHATLFMKHVTVNPNILIAHNTILTRQPAVYPYKRVEVKSFTLYPGNQSLSLDNVVMGQLPNLIVFAMVDSKAYNGDSKKNPYNFQHFNLQRFNLCVNSVQIPNQPIDFSFSNEEGIVSTRGYNTLFDGIGIRYHDRGHQITKELYDKGAFMLAFDLTADHSYDSHYNNLLNQGTLRIEGRFEKALADAVTCLVYCEFDATLHIDRNRNITSN